MEEMSNLPEGVILSKITPKAISKISTSIIDILHIRSVSATWKNICPLLPPPKPISFPRILPRIASSEKVVLKLHERTLYRVSPLSNPSFGWFCEVSKTKPQTLSGVFTQHMSSGTLNLLDHHISEICKPYSITCFGDFKDSSPEVVANKVIGLWNYVRGCDFAALVLQPDGSLTCWKIDLDCWTRVNTKGYHFRDLILYDGKCYAVDYTGMLVSIDFDLKLALVVPSSVGYDGAVTSRYLVQGKSDLYMVSKIIQYDYEDKKHDCYCSMEPSGIYYDHMSVKAFKLELEKLNKMEGNWDCTGDLRDMIFVLCNDVSLYVSPNDFGGGKGNRVYLIGKPFADGCKCDTDYILADGYSSHTGVYDFDESSGSFVWTSTIAGSGGKIVDPPSWLMALSEP